MTCSYRTCGNGLPTARLPERSESVRLSGTPCRVLAVPAVTGVRRRHPVAQRSGAERTAARGHGERTQTPSGQRAGRRRPRSRPGARGGGPVRRLREGGPSSPTHRASARDRRRVHRRPSRHLQGRPGPGGPGHSRPRRRTMPATYADRRLRAMPRSVAPGLSRPRSEQAPCRIGVGATGAGVSVIPAQIVLFWVSVE
jgi:hypothetical protein